MKMEGTFLINVKSFTQIPWHVCVKELKLSVRLYKPYEVVAATALPCLCSFGGDGGGVGLGGFLQVNMINHTFPLILPENV